MTDPAPEPAHRVDLRSDSDEETRAVGRKLARRLRGGDVVALSGPLGAGKTCFVRGLAEGLGLDPAEVTSPTFVLCQEYEPHRAPARGRGLALAHLDGYRIHDPDELDSLGWDELLASDDVVIAVEWAERFGNRMPARHVGVVLEHLTETSRAIVVAAPAGLAEQLELDRLIGPAPAHRCPICGDEANAAAPSFPCDTDS